MKNLSSKIVIALSSLALIGGLAACSSTVAPVEGDENAEEIESSSSADEDDVEVEEEVAKSSSSKKSSRSSSSKKVESSSSEEVVESSSSEEVVEESSSSEEVVESSSSEALPDKIDENKDKVAEVDEENLGEKVEESELPEDLTDDDSMTGGDLYVGKDEFDFENNDYYCKTPEGDWYILDGSKYDNFWFKAFNFLTWLFTGKSWLDYSKVCDVIYVHPKKSLFEE